VPGKKNLAQHAGLKTEEKNHPAPDPIRGGRNRPVEKGVRGNSLTYFAGLRRYGTHRRRLTQGPTVNQGNIGAKPDWRGARCGLPLYSAKVLKRKRAGA